MSNLIYACWRGEGGAISARSLGAVAARITPPGLEGHPCRIIEGSGELVGLTGPVGAASLKGTSAHLGAFAGSWPEWDRPGSPVPEGTFALVRSDAGSIELCSDFAGSRSIWYVHSPDRFLASTSQRALAALMGSLELNRKAFAWYLATGNNGPQEAWDGRLSRLPPHARLILDRASWRLRVESAPAEFNPQTASEAECQRDLQAILKRSIESFDFASARWAFPLSGGYDCRFILSALHRQGLRPRTVTWGLARSLEQPGNDAYVAQRLAGHFGLQHDYLLTERSQEAPEAVADRFVEASGGTTDQLFPYLDGLRLWTTLAGQGVDGVIRGDEGFGWIPVKDEVHARASVGITLLGDFLDEPTVEQIADGPQALPEPLRKRPEETIASYRDRLYHAYRIPIGLAALNDVKSPFVEIASPLLARPILEYVRRMPDSLRTDKLLFRKIARSEGPAIPYATMSADDDRNDYLWTPSYARWFEAELSGDLARRLLPEPFRIELLADLQHAPSAIAPSRSLRAALKRIIPTSWVRAVRAQLGAQAPSRRELTLRTALACRIIRMLEEDARVLQGASPLP